MPGRREARRDGLALLASRGGAGGAGAGKPSFQGRVHVHIPRAQLCPTS